MPETPEKETETPEEDLETPNEPFGITKNVVMETIAKAIIVTVTTAVVQVIAGRVAKAIELRRENRTLRNHEQEEDPS